VGVEHDGDGIRDPAQRRGRLRHDPRQHPARLDELQQKIQLEAMGLALGVAVVVGLAYSSLDVTNVIPWDAEISNLVILVALTYIAGVFIGQRRYA